MKRAGVVSTPALACLAAIGVTLKAIRDSSLLWWWGDWLNYGERRYGEKYSQAVDESDYARGSLRTAAWVCSRIELSRRLDNLSFNHHQAVAALEAQEQDMWLADATANGWSVHTFAPTVARCSGPETMKAARWQ